MVFSYLLFWLYLTFRDAQLLFGLATIGMAYVIFIHSVSVTILAILFLVFVVMGSHLQMVIQFGLMPVLGYQHGGEKFVNPQKEQEKMQKLQQKMAYGESLNEEEQAMAHQMYRSQGSEEYGSAARRMF